MLESYFFLSLPMETDSEKYRLVNDRVFHSQMTELTVPGEGRGQRFKSCPAPQRLEPLW